MTIGYKEQGQYLDKSRTNENAKQAATYRAELQVEIIGS